MLNWRRQEDSIPDPDDWTYSVPRDRRIYAIGDIHGRADLLQLLQSRIIEDAAAHHAVNPVVIYLGDYVDRGLNAREVLDILIEAPLPGFESIHLLGNHESFMLDFTAGVENGLNWLYNGGNTTLHSYGIKLPSGLNSANMLVEAQLEFREKMPPAHLQFLRHLTLSHTEGDYFFVHAGIRPGFSLDRQDPNDLIWIRDDFLNVKDEYEKIIVHGHSITEQVDWRNNRIGVDTGAYRSGRLTALVLQDNTVSAMSTAE